VSEEDYTQRVGSAVMFVELQQLREEKKAAELKQFLNKQNPFHK